MTRQHRLASTGFRRVATRPTVFTTLELLKSGLQAVAGRGILINMNLTPEDRRASHDTARLTPRERLERFAALQRRAAQLLAASPEGYRQYWTRNLRQRSIHEKF
ncbi:MAG TPA: hypothetical protein VJL29_07570 [Thermoguttaceae bacterium]|nr:hypothetical protein [Thermoguttaceae bacterium]